MTKKEHELAVNLELSEIEFEVDGVIDDTSLPWIVGELIVEADVPAYICENRRRAIHCKVGAYINGEQDDGEWCVAQEGTRILLGLLTGDSKMIQPESVPYGLMGAFPEACEKIGKAACEVLVNAFMNRRES